MGHEQMVKLTMNPTTVKCFWRVMGSTTTIIGEYFWWMKSRFWVHGWLIKSPTYLWVCQLRPPSFIYLFFFFFSSVQFLFPIRGKGLSSLTRGKSVGLHNLVTFLGFVGAAIGTIIFVWISYKSDIESKTNV